MAYKLWAESSVPVGSYFGKYEVLTYTFSTPFEQLPGEQELAAQFINKNIAELAAQGSQLLRIQVWRDTSPTWQTKYWVAVAASASPLFWNIIIIGVLAIFALIITWKILSVTEGIIEKAGDVFENFPGGVAGAIAGTMVTVLGIGLLSIGGIYLLTRRGK